ncbi:MAG TPA: DMT family transporter [Acidimicrobiales bacterium]
MTAAPRGRFDLVLLGVAVVAVSTSAPLIREADAPALAIAFWRTGLAVPLTGLLVVVSHRDELSALTPTARRGSTLAGVFLALHFATWIPSLSYTSVASSVALVCAMPVWTALLARWRGSPVGSSTWRGIILALSGVVLLTGVDFSVTPRALFGDLLALVGGIFSALYVDAGAGVRRQVSTAVYATICYGVAALLLLSVCLGGGQALAGYDGTTWLVLLGMLVGPQLLGHTVVNQVLRTMSPTTVSVAILGEIVGSALLAWIFFGEVPPVAALPAGVLIGAGVVLTRRPSEVDLELA